MNPHRFEGLDVSNIVLYTLVSLDGATDDPHRYFPETDLRGSWSCDALGIARVEHARSLRSRRGSGDEIAARRGDRRA